MSLRSVCFTGHRELPEVASTAYRTMVHDTQSAILSAIEEGATDFYAGGAQGYDLLCAELVLMLKARFPAIRLHLVLPYDGFARGERYQPVLEGADEIISLNASYRRGCLMMRNRRLVEEGDLCIAYLHQQTGGTAFTVSAARKKGIPVVLL